MERNNAKQYTSSFGKCLTTNVTTCMLEYENSARNDSNWDSMIPICLHLALSLQLSFCSTYFRQLQQRHAMVYPFHGG
jgi:hypothetical protein